MTPIAHNNTLSDHKQLLLSAIVNLLATFLLSISIGMSSVLIPVALDNSGISTTSIGFIMSLETISSLLISLFFPQLLRHIGVKKGLIISTVLRFPALLLFGFTHNSFLWILAVFFNGVGFFTFLMLLQIWIVGLDLKAHKVLIVSLSSTVASLGLAAGPLFVDYADLLYSPFLSFFNIFFSNAILALFTINHFNFTISSLLSLLSFFPLLFSFSIIPAFALQTNSGIWKSIMNAKGAMFAMAMAGVSSAGVSAFITLYGMQNNLTFSDAAFLLTAFTIGSLLLETPLTWLSDFIDRRYAIVIAAFLCLVCAVYLPIVIYVNYQAYILVFLWGGFIGAIYSIALALISDKYQGDELVVANIGYSITESAGGTIGLLCIGYSMEAFGVDGLPYVIMLSSILYFSFALTRYRIV